jgi:hypothetical protein
MLGWRSGAQRYLAPAVRACHIAVLPFTNVTRDRMTICSPTASAETSPAA